MPYRRLLWVLILSWSLAVVGSLVVNLVHHSEQVRSLTKQTARALVEKDMLYREWSILHGGVYVPKTGDIQPGPGETVEEREITTPLGQELTLLNPAVVSRQIFQLQEQATGIRGRLTSLNPIVPANQPDAWERAELLKFTHEAQESTTVETRDGERYFRLMRPLVLVPACLRCHEERGRQVGEIRGGISLTVPMRQFVTRGENERLALAHASLWLLGMCGVVLGARNLETHSHKRRQAEHALRAQYEVTQRTLREKEALLQEIHHRVKNNLQVISSLLQLQMNSVNDPRANAILRESQLRVRSMALIHEKLYQSDSLARIDLGQYLRELASLLFGTYARERARVRLEFDLAPVSVGIDTAIPLGLIVNELITNSLKFAFPDKRPGLIKVELKELTAGGLLLRIADDGIGLPPEMTSAPGDSLGLRLVGILTRQLQAEGAWEAVAAGASFLLRFRDKVPEKRGSPVTAASTANGSVAPSTASAPEGGSPAAPATHTSSAGLLTTTP